MQYDIEKELCKIVSTKLMEHERLLLTPRICFKNVKTMPKAKSLKVERSTCNILVTEV